MRTSRFALLGLFMVLVMAGTPLVARTAVAQSNGLEGDHTYTSPQFGYTLTWTDDWGTRERDVTSNPGGFDSILISSNDGDLLVQGQPGRISPVDAVTKRIDIQGTPEQVITDHLDAEIPSVEMLVGRNRIHIESFSLSDVGATILIVLTAREREYDAALAAAQNDITFNDQPILSGAAPGSGTTGDAVPTETATAPPAEATEAPPTGGGPGSDGRSTGEATATSETGGTTETPGRYTGDVYGYTLQYDPDIWEVLQEDQNEDGDLLLLASDTGTAFIWSTSMYGNDAVACLDGESAYYGETDPTVSDWTPATGEDGKVLRAEGEGYAWGVFTLTYTSEDEGSEAVDLADYIECRAIPGTDAVVIMQGSSSPEMYNDHLQTVLDILDTLTFADGSQTETELANRASSNAPVERSTTAQVTDPDAIPGLDGRVYTSPGFGYTMPIPDQWRIVGVETTDADEKLTLSNGISEVTFWATSGYTGDLAGCVDAAADASGLDLTLQTNYQGEAFRGANRSSAYGNFTYQSADKEEIIYFVSCQPLGETGDFLITIQDVPSVQFAAQRGARVELQKAIQLP